MVERFWLSAASGSSTKGFRLPLILSAFILTDDEFGNRVTRVLCNKVRGGGYLLPTTPEQIQTTPELIQTTPEQIQTTPEQIQTTPEQRTLTEEVFRTGLRGLLHQNRGVRTTFRDALLEHVYTKHMPVFDPDVLVCDAMVVEGMDRGMQYVGFDRYTEDDMNRLLEVSGVGEGYPGRRGMSG